MLAVGQNDESEDLRIKQKSGAKQKTKRVLNP